MTGQDEPLVAFGDVITVGPDDYFVSYGVVVGRLRMRVTHVTGDTRVREGATWLQLMGVQLLPGGEDGPRVTVHARVKALAENPPERPETKPLP